MAARMTQRFGAAIAALLLVLAARADAATFTLNNLDGPGEGFNDPTPVAPVGGNPGTTLGQQRINVFLTAGRIWGAYLPDNVNIVIDGNFDPLTPCDSTSGVLGSAGAATLASDFTNAPVAATWYSIALANKLAGTDLAPTVSDIVAHFNSSVDNSTCLGTSSWYYGYDHNEGTDVDLLAVVLHELGHGLGFQSFVNISTGGLQNGKIDIFSRHLYDDTVALHWDAMSNAQRAASAINTGKLVWDGANVTVAAPIILGPAEVVRITSPASIAGEKDFGTADFGGAPPDPPISAQVMLVNDGVGTTSDACDPIPAGQLTGKIALIDRGSCTFVSKAKNAQTAGAIAVIIGNNTTGAPPEMTGVDPSVTIPVVSISQSDATAIKGQLGTGVSATIGIDHTRLAGTDLSNRPRMYAPNPIQSGSSVSHWDTPETPNLLMEPFINSDLTDNVDLTQYVFADIGWYTGAASVAVAPTSGAPRAFASPNPFTSATAIHFQLAHSGPADVAVFDSRGELIKRFPVSWRPAGAQRVDWDGTTNLGGKAPAGVYFWRVEAAGNPETTGRMVRVQ